MHVCVKQEITKKNYGNKTYIFSAYSLNDLVFIIFEEFQ